MVDNIYASNNRKCADPSDGSENATYRFAHHYTVAVVAQIALRSFNFHHC